MKFSAKPVIWIHVRAPQATIVEFFRWCLENKIYDAVHAGAIGPGFFSHAYKVDDAERIVEWLRTHRAQEV